MQQRIVLLKKNVQAGVKALNDGLLHEGIEHLQKSLLLALYIAGNRELPTDSSWKEISEIDDLWKVHQRICRLRKCGACPDSLSKALLHISADKMKNGSDDEFVSVIGKYSNRLESFIEIALKQIQDESSLVKKGNGWGVLPSKIKRRRWLAVSRCGSCVLD